MPAVPREQMFVSSSYSVLAGPTVKISVKWSVTSGVTFDEFLVHYGSNIAPAGDKIDSLPATARSYTFTVPLPAAGETGSYYFCARTVRGVGPLQSLGVESCKTFTVAGPALPPPPGLDSLMIYDSTGTKIAIRPYIYPRAYEFRGDAADVVSNHATMDSVSGLLTMYGANNHLLGTKQYCMGFVLTDSSVQLSSASKKVGCSGQGLLTAFGPRYNATATFAPLKPYFYFVESM
jgi:hypothetical protein